MREREYIIQSILRNDSDMSETNRRKLEKELNQLKENPDNE